MLGLRGKYSPRGERIVFSSGNSYMVISKEGEMKEKTSLLFISERRDLQSEWLIRCTPEYTLNAPNVKPTNAIG